MKRLALLLLPALLTACPGGDMPPPGGADLAVPQGPDLSAPPPPERAYDGCVAFYEALFGHYEQCGVGLYSIAVDSYTRYLCTRIQQRVDGATARYDRDKLSACLGALQTSTCTTGALLQVTSPDGCGVLVGLRPPGAGCFDGVECAGGYCDTGAACPGTCRGYADAGQSCAAIQCRTGLYCNAATCTVLPTANQPCAGSRCALGLFCDAGTCKEPKPSGPCLQSAECSLGTRCVGAVPPNMKGQCVPYKKIQEPCADDAECTSGLQCADGQCYTYPRAGGSCGKLAGHSKIIGCVESYCDAATGMPGRCQARIAEGQFCDSARSDQCAIDTNCVTNRCTRTACFAFR